eukprot:7797849-Alexandrium_andersonii.AAC.1
MSCVRTVLAVARAPTGTRCACAYSGFVSARAATIVHCAGTVTCPRSRSGTLAGARATYVLAS